MKIKKILEEFKGGDWLYLCFNYMNKLHLEPKSWFDLFDFLLYTETENKIIDYYKAVQNKE